MAAATRVRPEAGPDSDTVELASTLRQVVLRLTRRLRAQRADMSVSVTQLMALGTLAKHGPMSAGELAAHERVQPPSMTKILAALEEHGLAQRRQDPSDRRQVIVQATPAGDELLAKERLMRDSWLATRLVTLTAEERRLLRKVAPLLQRLAEE
jgi:DNA-binding MarR family transcriptional regulator